MSLPWYANPHEQHFAEWARAQGWSVTKLGWPDFICRRGDEVMAVEVKGGNDGLRSEQTDTIRDLQRMGMPTFLWTPELGLTDPIGVSPDSVAALRAERAALIRMLREAYEAPMEMRRARNKLVRGGTVKSETKALLEVQAMCLARHEGHQARVPDEGLNLCAWLVKMSKHLTVTQMAEVVGLESDDIERNLAYALNRRDKFLAKLEQVHGHAA